MTDTARTRLNEERKMLAKDKPFGMFAKPTKSADGSVDLMKWYCGILPRAGSLWALPDGETYRVRLQFNSEFPFRPPTAYFDPPIFHPNVFPSGAVCLSILLEEGHHGGRGEHGKSHWSVGTSISTILVALQTFLEEPNPMSVALPEAASLCREDRGAYETRVRSFAAKYTALLESIKEKERKAEADKK
jgi:ubiquitin-conjugating enzyme E2 I